VTQELNVVGLKPPTKIGGFFINRMLFILVNVLM
jgi:hypothetical protein